MSYREFSLENLQETFGLELISKPLFGELEPLKPSTWLTQTLDKGMLLARASEKARSEFIVAPVLLALRDYNQKQISIYSGSYLDSDADRGLKGECDFVITKTPYLPIIQTPIISLVEAKKNDVESGLGQCGAQMLGAQILNERTGSDTTKVYGCVTTGEDWQFLKLEANTLNIDTKRYYVNNLGLVLAVLQNIVEQY